MQTTDNYEMSSCYHNIGLNLNDRGNMGGDGELVLRTAFLHFKKSDKSEQKTQFFSMTLNAVVRNKARKVNTVLN